MLTCVGPVGPGKDVREAPGADLGLGVPLQSRQFRRCHVVSVVVISHGSDADVGGLTTRCRIWV